MSHSCNGNGNGNSSFSKVAKAIADANDNARVDLLFKIVHFHPTSQLCTGLICDGSMLAQIQQAFHMMAGLGTDHSHCRADVAALRRSGRQHGSHHDPCAAATLSVAAATAAANHSQQGHQRRQPITQPKSLRAQQSVDRGAKTLDRTGRGS